MFVSWDSFTETVREFLTVDGVRKGSLTQKYLARLIRAAALDLQAHVPSLKPHFRKEFPVEDLAKTKDNGMYVSSGEFSSSSTSVIAAIGFANRFRHTPQCFTSTFNAWLIH